jgi:predicted RNA binding protein YcfA (HicA-like mRNA interferase family)
MIAEEPSRKIKKRLRDAGFVPERTQGSHTFWVGPNGAAVAVPDGHRTISPGVVRKVNNAIADSKLIKTKNLKEEANQE